MANLFLVRLRPNKEKMSITPNVAELKKEHSIYIESLVEKGIILFGGPIVDQPGGMLVVKSETIEEVTDTFNKDPMIIPSLIEIKVHRWTIKHGTLEY